MPMQLVFNAYKWTNFCSLVFSYFVKDSVSRAIFNNANMQHLMWLMLVDKRTNQAHNMTDCTITI